MKKSFGALHHSSYMYKKDFWKTCTEIRLKNSSNSIFSFVLSSLGFRLSLCSLHTLWKRNEK